MHEKFENLHKPEEEDTLMLSEQKSALETSKKKRPLKSKENLIFID